MMRTIVPPPRSIPVGQGPAVTLSRRPVRALALLVLSRLLLGAMLVLPVLLVVERYGSDPLPEPSREPGEGAVSDGDGVGLTGLVALLDVQGTGTAGTHRVVDLVVAPAGTGAADVQVVVLSAVDGAGTVEAATTSLSQAGLRSVRVGSVLAVPEGVRIEADARVVLSSAPLPAIPSAGDARLATDLPPRIAEVGADLVRLDVPRQDGAPARLVVRGTRDELLDVAHELERGFTSSRRLVALRAVSTPDGRYELQVSFGLRTRASAPGTAAGPPGVRGARA